MDVDPVWDAAAGSGTDPLEPVDSGLHPGAGASGGSGSATPPDVLADAAPAALDAGGSDAAADAQVLEPRLDSGGPIVSPLDPVLAERYRVLSERLGVLAARTQAFWVEHGPDSTFGGFHGTLNRSGNPIAPDDKGLIQQVRHLWMLSTWYERREASASVASLANESYEFIAEHFVDAADGAFVFKVSRDGRRVVDAKKQMFAESYAIYALSTYGRVFGVESALTLALGRFVSIDTERHDLTFGGYDQRGDPGVGSAQTEKDANTHLHLLEAFTALYEATANATVGARLNELCDLFATRLLRPSGYVHAEFRLDWTPVGAANVSYGHDLESAWLLLEAARVLGRADDPSLRAAALQMAQHSAARGFDAQAGGYFELGVPGGASTDFDKVWWVQFEALAGLWWAYEIGGDPLQLERLEATLGWIEQSEDLPIGEWFAITRADGTAVGADYKGDEWKASYHSVRALVFVQDWIDQALARGATR